MKIPYRLTPRGHHYSFTPSHPTLPYRNPSPVSLPNLRTPPSVTITPYNVRVKTPCPNGNTPLLDGSCSEETVTPSPEAGMWMVCPDPLMLDVETQSCICGNGKILEDDSCIDSIKNINYDEDVDTKQIIGENHDDDHDKDDDDDDHDQDDDEDDKDDDDEDNDDDQYVSEGKIGGITVDPDQKNTEIFCPDGERFDLENNSCIETENTTPFTTPSTE